MKEIRLLDLKVGPPIVIEDDEVVFYGESCRFPVRINDFEQLDDSVIIKRYDIQTLYDKKGKVVSYYGVDRDKWKIAMPIINYIIDSAIQFEVDKYRMKIDYLELDQNALIKNFEYLSNKWYCKFGRWIEKIFGRK